MANQNSDRKQWYINNGVIGFELSSLPRCHAISATTRKQCKRPALKHQDYCGIHSGRYAPGAPLGNTNGLVHGLNGKDIRDNIDEANLLIGNMDKTVVSMVKVIETTKLER